MADDDSNSERDYEGIDFERLDEDSTDVFDASDEEWPPEYPSNEHDLRPGDLPKPTDSSGRSERSSGDPTPAHTHQFTPDTIESILEEETQIPSLITLTGPRAGQARRLDAERVLLGRHREEVDIWFGDRGVSRRHAVIERTDQDTFAIRDLDSSNGTYVNGRRVEGRQQLEDGDKIVLSKRAILHFTLQDLLDEQFQKHMYESSVRDGLTDAYSRAYLDEQLQSDMAFDERHDTQTALALLDIDHFKRVNDEYGHPVGDGVLIRVVELIDANIRAEDLVARYGGEEFAILLRNTDPGAVRRVAERIREAVADTTFEVRGAEVDITVSVGGTMYDPVSMSEPQDWLFAADRALYEAKSDGRNCARIYEGHQLGNEGDDTPPLRPS